LPTSRLKKIYKGRERKRERKSFEIGCLYCQSENKGRPIKGDREREREREKESESKKKGRCKYT
jgi:hypothetical protein